MGTRFTAPEGALRSNLGLLAGTVIRELRIHPFLDKELEGGSWNFRPEWLEFTILSVVSGGYRCRYSGEEEPFAWSSWRSQPNHGYMEDDSTPVRYYVKEAPLPPPYEGKPGFSPYELRWMEIDEAALLIRDPDAFAEAAAAPETGKTDPYAFHERPSRKFTERGGCPFYQGLLNWGCGSSVLCEAVRPHLHGHVGIKFCEEGRKAYCPIWRAKGGQ